MIVLVKRKKRKERKCKECEKRTEKSERQENMCIIVFRLKRKGKSKKRFIRNEEYEENYAVGWFSPK
jgi:hypothetical protein